MSEYGIVERELRWGNVRNGVMGRERRGGREEEFYRDWETDQKSTRLNSSHSAKSRMPSSA